MLAAAVVAALPARREITVAEGAEGTRVPLLFGLAATLWAPPAPTACRGL